MNPALTSQKKWSLILFSVEWWQEGKCKWDPEVCLTSAHQDHQVLRRNSSLEGLKEYSQQPWKLEEEPLRLPHRSRPRKTLRSDSNLCRTWCSKLNLLKRSKNRKFLISHQITTKTATSTFFPKTLNSKRPPLVQAKSQKHYLPATPEKVVDRIATINTICSVFLTSRQTKIARLDFARRISWWLRRSRNVGEFYTFIYCGYVGYIEWMVMRCVSRLIISFEFIVRWWKGNFAQGYILD